jgi:hypothetical protein
MHCSTDEGLVKKMHNYLPKGVILEGSKFEQNYEQSVGIKYGLRDKMLVTNKCEIQ